MIIKRDKTESSCLSLSLDKYKEEDQHRDHTRRPRLQEDSKKIPRLQRLQDSKTLKTPASQTERYCILGAARIFSDELFCNMSGKV